MVTQEQVAVWALPPPRSGTGSGNPLASVAYTKTDGGRGCGQILPAAYSVVVNVTTDQRGHSWLFFKAI